MSAAVIIRFKIPGNPPYSPTVGVTPLNDVVKPGTQLVPVILLAKTMKITRYIALLFCLTAAAFAKPKEFTILGGEKIKAEVERGMPVPAEKDGIKIEVAAFMIGDGKLVFTFGFDTQKTPKKVVVEDVSGSSPVVLVEDSAPVVKKNYWRGDAAPLPLSKSGVPWVFERGDTTKVFRFTVTLPDQEQPVVLFQPAIYASTTKKQLEKMAR